MAGLAKTDAFMLETASLMLGKVADLLILEETHSVGLVKNLVFKSVPSFTKLSQGVRNTMVHSQMTGNEVTAEGEMYEYTASNVSYAVGLDGSAVVASTDRDLDGTIASSTTLTVTSEDLAKFTAGDEGVGDRVMVQLVDDPENIQIRRIITAATTTLTLDTALPASFAVSEAVKISRPNNIALGSQADQPFLAGKVFGKLANGDPVVLLMPKIRITSGLNYGFKSDSYDHIPLSLELYDLVTTDPFYAMFQKVGPEKKPAKAMLSTLL